MVSPLNLRRLGLKLGDFTLDVADWQAGVGECVALIGKNGCGKTTMMESMLGLRRVNVLDGTILGAPFSRWASRPDLRQRVGALLQRSAPPAGLYVRDMIFLHRKLYSVSSGEVAVRLGVTLLADKRYDRLSRGETQRVDLFMALAHEPRLIFLDEPFTGLDARYADVASELLAERGDRTVVMSCHRAAELTLATRITWIAAGGVKADATPDSLRRRLLHDCRMRIRFPDATAARLFFDQSRGVAGVEVSIDSEVLSLSGREDALEGMRHALNGQPVTALEFGQTTLTDVLHLCAQEDTSKELAHAE